MCIDNLLETKLKNIDLRNIIKIKWLFLIGDQTFDV